MYNNDDESFHYDVFDENENLCYNNIELANLICSENDIKYSELPTKVTHNDLINNNVQDSQDQINKNNQDSQHQINKNLQDLQDKINNYIKNIEMLTHKTNRNEINDSIFTKKKRERLKINGAHNKFSDDNLRRKCKHLILKTTLDYINDQILQKYNNNVGNGIFRKQLLTINQKQKADATVQFNKDFLEKSLKEIFSENISSRYTIFPINHNQKVINELINDKDEEKSQYFKNLFKLTFTQCLEHFRQTKFYEELKGLNGLIFIKNKYGNDPDYLETLNYYIMNYENITNNKRARNRKKKEKKHII